ncbi:hypothetical protein AWJ14_21205 [Hoeflea olei]|uniref:Uncharacterized protein n=2 Tax=Hoeflea olei TaxID=1480615 RepID=A0A1C1YZJ2_9HYPH|nr:hypothetical protein AWJ14_21205 [Hoeflea olei]
MHAKALASLAVTLAFAAFLPLPAANAQSGAECVFTIHNDTDRNTLTGFYTSEDDGDSWSDNWLDDRLEPGQSARAEFSADTCACDQVFQAGWLSADKRSEILDDPHTIDICTASNVYLGDDEITFD